MAQHHMHREDAQTMAEYAIVLSVISIVIITAIGGLSGVIGVMLADITNII